MSWGLAALAGVGGAAKGIESRQRFDQGEQLKRDLERQREEIRQMIASMSDTTKRRGQDLTDAEKADALKLADKKRQDAADATREKLNLMWSGQQQTGDIAYDAHDIQRRGQDIQEGQFWGGTMPLGWDRNAATREGQATSAATTRRGQDITATTARRGQDIGASTAAAGQAGASQRTRTRNVLDILKLKQHNDAGLGDPNADFPEEFDRLYNDPNAMGGEAARALSAASPAAPAGGVPPPTAAPPVAPVRPPVPGPQSKAAPAADPRMALASQLVALTKQITAMPAGPQRDAAKKQLATLRQQADALRASSPPGQD